MIGAGPAGLTAAVYLARFRRNFRVIDGGASRAAWIPMSHNHPGFPEGIRGRTLLARLRRQAERYSARIETGTVSDLRAKGGAFRLALEGQPLRARKVILATGVVDNEPAIPGVEDAVLNGLIRICPICDGFEVIGETVGVIGRDALGAREALFLTTYSHDVSLIHVGPAKALPRKERAQLAKAGIEVIETSLDRVVLDRRRIAALCFAGSAPRAFDTLYSALGVTPRTGLAVDAGARLDDGGRLYVNEHRETSVPGLYAAG
ncbi:MAG: NAD(P)/FAD-dependent oxidoreductase, partial [Phenylobacterium sp.]